MKRVLKEAWDTLSYVDLFSLEPSSRITFQNKRVYSSTNGKIMSILCLLCSVGAFIYFGMNMMTRSSPQTIIAEIYQNTPDYLKIFQDNFFFSFGMKNLGSNEMLIDETIFVPHLYAISEPKSNKSAYSKVEIKVGPCSPGDNPTQGGLGAYFKTNPTNNMYCIKNYSNVEMFGSEDSDSYRYLQLIFAPCQNGTGGSICKSIDEINNFFNLNYFYSSYTSDAADSLNYQTPLNQHGDFYSCTTIGARTSKVYWDFTHLYVTTDDGIIFQNNYSVRGLTKTNDRIFYINRQNVTSDAFLDLTLRLSKVARKYERKYDKLQEVLANTGGAIKIMIIFALVMTRPVIFFNFYRDLGNEYFDFELSLPGNSELTKQKLKISFFQYCTSFIRPNNLELRARRTIWDKSKVILNEQLSLSQILNKIVQLEKLKYLLFDNYELTLFNRMPKPIVEEVNNNLSDSKTRPSGVVAWNKSFFHMAAETDFMMAVNKIQQKKNKSELDQRMLKLLVPKQERITGGKLATKKYTFIKPGMRDYQIDEETGFPKILSNNLVEEEKKEAKTPYIDTRCILKDLEMIHLKKNKENSEDFDRNIVEGYNFDRSDRSTKGMSRGRDRKSKKKEIVSFKNIT